MERDFEYEAMWVRRTLGLDKPSPHIAYFLKRGSKEWALERMKELLCVPPYTIPTPDDKEKAG